jgi:hypothetical protein
MANAMLCRGGDHSKRPHYHFQMYVDGLPFVRFNDYHLPLSDADAGFLSLSTPTPKSKTVLQDMASVSNLREGRWSTVCC